jgi:glycerophosphoryl diester phosphodiesterase
VALACEAVDYLEADLWLEHGRLEVRHARRAWPFPVYWERGRLFVSFERFPSLEDVASAAGEMRLYLDLKGKNVRLADAVIVFVRDHGLEDAVVFSSPEWSLLDRVRARLGAPCFYTLNSDNFEHRVGEVLAGGFDYVAVNHRLLDAARVARLKEAGCQMVAWTVNSLDRARQLIGWGVDGVVSDHVAILEALKADAARRAPQDAEAARGRQTT